MTKRPYWSTPSPANRCGPILVSLTAADDRRQGHSCVQPKQVNAYIEVMRPLTSARIGRRKLYSLETLRAGLTHWVSTLDEEKPSFHSKIFS
jgi:hypothetical protein